MCVRTIDDGSRRCFARTFVVSPRGKNALGATSAAPQRHVLAAMLEAAQLRTLYEIGRQNIHRD
jgi:hypothetical protein